MIEEVVVARTEVVAVINLLLLISTMIECSVHTAVENSQMLQLRDTYHIARISKRKVR